MKTIWALKENKRGDTRGLSRMALREMEPACFSNRRHKILQIPFFQQSIRQIDKKYRPPKYDKYFVPVNPVIKGNLFTYLICHRLHRTKARERLFEQVPHGVKWKETHDGVCGLRIKKFPPQHAPDKSLEDLPQNKKSQRKSRTFDQYPKEETEGKEADKFH
jgi:hypothetical protein